jgi:hypothetical protein
LILGGESDPVLSFESTPWAKDELLDRVLQSGQKLSPENRPAAWHTIDELLEPTSARSMLVQLPAPLIVDLSPQVRLRGLPGADQLRKTQIQLFKEL